MKLKMTTPQQLIRMSLQITMMTILWMWGSNLVNKMPTIEGNIFKYVKGNYLSGTHVTETNPAEIFNIVNSLKISSSTGSDGTPRNFKKYYFHDSSSANSYF